MPEIQDATANMTLGAIKKRDIDNLKLLMDVHANERPFSDIKHALVFLGKTVDKCLLKLGIDQRKMYEDFKLDTAEIKALMDQPVNVVHINRPTSDTSMKDLINKIDALMDEKDVKVERRQYTDSNDAWRSGIYIYHQNEIAYFISEPYRRKGGHYASPHIIVPTIGKVWFVLTNFKE